MTPSHEGLHSYKRILVIRPDEIGDVVLTTPLLRELRRAAPRAKISLIVKTACLPLVEHCPHIDATTGFDFLPSTHRRLNLIRQALSLRVSAFARRGFDLVLLPRRGPDSYQSLRLARFLAGPASILAHREEEAVDPSPTSTKRLFFFKNRVIEHEVLHNMRFLEFCGAGPSQSNRLELWLTKADRDFAARTLRDQAHGYFAVATGAGARERRWPIARFVEICARLQRAFGLTPILLGAPDDPGFVGSINLLGRTSLRQAAALLERCRLYVGNDTGLMHMAAAMGTPVVEISGFSLAGKPDHYNSPHRFGPWGTHSRVAQPRDRAESLAIEDVTTDDVFSCCRSLLAETSRAPLDQAREVEVFQ